MDQISGIKLRLNIVDIALKLGFRPDKSGFIKSIYKDEKTPSLKLYAESNSFYCFSMSHGGDIIEFYKDACRIGFSQAVRELSRIVGIEKIDYTSSGNYAVSKPPAMNHSGNKNKEITSSMTSEEKEIYFERLGISDNPNEAFRAVKIERLKSNKAVFNELYSYCIETGFSREAICYLTIERGLPEKSIKDFKIFFIKNYNEINCHLKKTFPFVQLQNSGLFNHKENGSGNMKFYQHRIIIPYLHNNEIVYLRGRYFDQRGCTKTDYCKYMGLNNDGLGLNISKRFFNSDVLKSMLKGERLYIVEGEFDSIALESIGFNTIGIPGAGNIPDAGCFNRLQDFDICLCVDNDLAGNKLRNSLGNIFTQHRKIYSVKALPVKDINEFIIQK